MDKSNKRTYNKVDDIPKQEIEHLKFRFVEDYLLCVISECLKEGLISKESDIAYIKEKVYDMYDSSIDRIFFQMIYTDSLEESIKLELDHKYYFQAILLATTCIEHILNDFYWQYYENVCNLSNAKILELLKANGISEKTNGLFSITFNKTFPEDLAHQINLLKNKRNVFVHYKPKKVHIDSLDEDSKSDANIEEIAKSSIDIINNLKTFISNMEADLYPEYIVAQEIYSKIKLEENKNGQT